MPATAGKMTTAVSDRLSNQWGFSLLLVRIYLQGLVSWENKIPDLMVTPIGISLWKILSAAVHSSDWQWQLGWILSVDRALHSLCFKNDAKDPFPSVPCHKLGLWMNGWMHASLLSSATKKKNKPKLQSHPWNDMLSKFTHMHLTRKCCPKASWASPSKHWGCIFFCSH